MAIEATTRRTALTDVLEAIIAAAMRGQYELLLAEIERAVLRLLPGTRAQVLMHVGGKWREWSALDGGHSQPLASVPKDMHEWGQVRRFGSQVFVPIVVGAVGVMVDGLDHDYGSSDGLDVLRQCVALALQTCERQRIATQSLDEVQALQRVATQILKSHDLSEILLHITQEAKRLLAADICGVLLRDGDQIAMRRCVGNHSPETASLRMRPGQGLAGRVLERREPSVVEDYLTSDTISQDFFHLAEVEMVRSALAAPLLGRDAVIGVLEVWRRRPSTFTPLDIIRLVALSNLTSIAIENAELYDTQSRMVDELRRANDALNQRYDTVRSLSNLTQSLMQVLLHGGTLLSIVTTASTFLQDDVAILDSDGQAIAWSGGRDPSTILPIMGLNLSASAGGDRSAADRLVIENAHGQWRAQQVVVEDDIVGWVLVRVGSAGADITDLTLTQVAMITAIHRLEQRAAGRARSETIDAIVWDLLSSDEIVRTAAIDRAADIKLDLAGPLRLYVCEMGGPVGSGSERTVSSVRSQMVQVVGSVKPGGLRAVAMHGMLLAVVCTAEPLEDAERLAHRLAQRLNEALSGRPVFVGGSSCCEHARALPVAYRESLIALDVARQLRRTGSVVYDRAGVVGMLLSLRHESGMQRFLELNFGRLLNEDEKHRDQLMETLRVFFDVNCSHETGAQRLGVHRKTIGNRLAKISDLTGLDFSTHDDRLVADLSLYVYRMMSRPGE